MLNDDILEHIISKTNNKETNITLRCCTKMCKSIVDKKIKYANIDHIYARATFLELFKCSCCEKVMMEKDIKPIVYTYDGYPKRIILHCQNFDCFAKALKRFFVDSIKIGVYPFVEWKDIMINVSRSKGGFSRGRIQKNSPIIFKMGVPYALTEFEVSAYKKKPKQVDTKEIKPQLEKNVELTNLPEDCYQLNKMFINFFPITYTEDPFLISNLTLS